MHSLTKLVKIVKIIKKIAKKNVCNAEIVSKGVNNVKIMLLHFKLLQLTIDKACGIDFTTVKPGNAFLLPYDRQFNICGRRSNRLQTIVSGASQLNQLHNILMLDILIAVYDLFFWIKIAESFLKVQPLILFIIDTE